MKSDLIIKHLLNNTDRKGMIDNIITDDEKSRKEFDAYLKIWEKSSGLKAFEETDVEEGWAKVRLRMNRMQTSRKIPLRSFLIRMAAIFIFALGLTWFLFQLMQKVTETKDDYFEFASEEKIRTLELSDGSTITLNKHSKIIRNKDFGVSNRNILLEGEAFFEVANNKGLPFTVHIQQSMVKVLGTSFNVKKDSARVIVGVVTGRVAFYQSGNESNGVELTKGNTGVHETERHIFTKEIIFDKNMLGWHTGVFEFKDTPVGEIFKTLADFFDKELEFEADVPVDEEINYLFDNFTLAEAMGDIELSLSNRLKAEAKGNKLIIRKP